MSITGYNSNNSYYSCYQYPSGSSCASYSSGSYYSSGSSGASYSSGWYYSSGSSSASYSSGWYYSSGSRGASYSSGWYYSSGSSGASYSSGWYYSSGSSGASYSSGSYYTSGSSGANYSSGVSYSSSAYCTSGVSGSSSSGYININEIKNRLIAQDMTVLKELEARHIGFIYDSKTDGFEFECYYAGQHYQIYYTNPNQKVEEATVGNGSWSVEKIAEAGIDLTKNKKYFIGVYNNYFRFDQDAIKSDFPGKSIISLADLKSAIDELEAKNSETEDVESADGCRQVKFYDDEDSDGGNGNNYRSISANEYSLLPENLQRFFKNNSAINGDSSSYSLNWNKDNDEDKSIYSELESYLPYLQDYISEDSSGTISLKQDIDIQEFLETLTKAMLVSDYDNVTIGNNNENFNKKVTNYVNSGIIEQATDLSNLDELYEYNITNKSEYENNPALMMLDKYFRKNLVGLISDRLSEHPEIQDFDVEQFLSSINLSEFDFKSCNSFEEALSEISNVLQSNVEKYLQSDMQNDVNKMVKKAEQADVKKTDNGYEVTLKRNYIDINEFVDSMLSQLPQDQQDLLLRYGQNMLQDFISNPRYTIIRDLGGNGCAVDTLVQYLEPGKTYTVEEISDKLDEYIDCILGNSAQNIADSLDYDLNVYDHAKEIFEMSDIYKLMDIINESPDLLNTFVANTLSNKYNLPLKEIQSILDSYDIKSMAQNNLILRDQNTSIYKLADNIAKNIRKDKYGSSDYYTESFLKDVYGLNSDEIFQIYKGMMYGTGVWYDRDFRFSENIQPKDMPYICKLYSDAKANNPEINSDIFLNIYSTLRTNGLPNSSYGYGIGVVELFKNKYNMDNESLKELVSSDQFAGIIDVIADYYEQKPGTHATIEDVLTEVGYFDVANSLNSILSEACSFSPEVEALVNDKSAMTEIIAEVLEPLVFADEPIAFTYENFSSVASEVLSKYINEDDALFIPVITATLFTNILSQIAGTTDEDELDKYYEELKGANITFKDIFGPNNSKKVTRGGGATTEWHDAPREWLKQLFLGKHSFTINGKTVTIDPVKFVESTMRDAVNYLYDYKNWGTSSFGGQCLKDAASLFINGVADLDFYGEIREKTLMDAMANFAIDMLIGAVDLAAVVGTSGVGVGATDKFASVAAKFAKKLLKQDIVGFLCVFKKTRTGKQIFDKIQQVLKDILNTPLLKKAIDYMRKKGEQFLDLKNDWTLGNVSDAVTTKDAPIDISGDDDKKEEKPWEHMSDVEKVEVLSEKYSKSEYSIPSSVRQALLKRLDDFVKATKITASSVGVPEDAANKYIQEILAEYGEGQLFPLSIPQYKYREALQGVNLNDNQEIEKALRSISVSMTVILPPPQGMLFVRFDDNDGWNTMFYGVADNIKITVNGLGEYFINGQPLNNMGVTFD